MSSPGIDRLVILGAGGHGREVAEIAADAEQAGGPRLVGFLDDDAARWGTDLDGVPVVGGWDWLREQDRQRLGVAVAVGRPEVTARLLDRVEAEGFRIARVISPRAYVSPRAELHDGCLVFPFVSIHTRAVVGAGTTLNVGASLSHDTRVGRACNINPGARLAGLVTVGDGAYIGMMAAVIQGVRVGAWSVVGAGAVVIRDLPAHVTAVGAPARPIKDLPRDRHLGG